MNPEYIYNLFPRKVGKREALKAIDSAYRRLLFGVEQKEVGPQEVWAFLVEKTTIFAQSPAGNRGQFTPHPATWFNKSRYLDDENEWFTVYDYDPREQSMSRLRASEGMVRRII